MCSKRDLIKLLRSDGTKDERVDLVCCTAVMVVNNSVVVVITTDVVKAGRRGCKKDHANDDKEHYR